MIPLSESELKKLNKAKEDIEIQCNQILPDIWARHRIYRECYKTYYNFKNCMFWIGLKRWKDDLHGLDEKMLRYGCRKEQDEYLRKHNEEIERDELKWRIIKK